MPDTANHTAQKQQEESLDQPWPAWEEEVLPELQRQMTAATFDTIFKQTVAYREDGRISILAPNDMVRDWIENRQSDLIKRTLVPFVGEDVANNLGFGVFIAEELPPDTSPDASPATPDIGKNGTNGASPNGTSGTGAMPALAVATAPPVPTADEEKFVSQTKFHALKKSMGFWLFEFQYDNQFWSTFMRTKAYHLKRRMEDHWLEEYSKPEERDVENPANYWTPPFRASYGDMASWLGVKKLAVVQGGENECYYSRQGHLRQQPLRECCGKYTSHDWRETEPGCHQCYYWRPGLLQWLYDLGLLAIEIHKPGSHPRTHRIYIQVWRVLPFLTPLQVSTLPPLVQRDHKQWLKNFGHYFNLTYSQWQSWNQPNHIPLLPSYQEGLRLHGQPEQNPFLPSSMLPCGNKDGDFKDDLEDDDDADQE